MTEDKTKVKDLATELGVPTKNLLQALRELDIPAKSTSSNIAAEDIDRVKNHLKDSATSEQGDRREVQPGVIVRRRRQSTEDVAAEGEEAPRAERRAPRENHTPTARIVSVPGASEAQDAAPVPSAEPEAPAAPEVSVQEPVKDAAEEKPAPVAEADKADDQKPRQPRDNRQKKRSGLREAAPVAKVISRPQDIAAAKAAEEAAAKAAAEAAAAAAKAAAEAAAAAKKTEEAEKPRKAQPAASARPEGSSAPSLLPPVSEGNRSSSSDGEDDDRRDRRKPRRPQEPATPQVRVISRPDPAAVAAARTQQAAQSDGRDNRNAGRDGQARDGRPGQPRDGRPGQGRTTTARPAPAIRARALPAAELPETSLPVPRPAARSRTVTARARKNATRPPAVPSIFRTPRTTGAAAAMIWMMCRAEADADGPRPAALFRRPPSPSRPSSAKSASKKPSGWPTWLTRWA